MKDLIDAWENETSRETRSDGEIQEMRIYGTGINNSD